MLLLFLLNFDLLVYHANGGSHRFIKIEQIYRGFLFSVYEFLFENGYEPDYVNVQFHFIKKFQFSSYQVSGLRVY